MAYARTNRSPALLASALFHAAVVAIAIVGLPWFTKPLQMGKVVPVTIITSGPSADLAPAEEAPQPQEAMAPAPQPQAPPEPAPISSAPPTPPAPAAQPKATTPPPKPSQSKPSQAKPDTDFFKDIENSLSRDRKPSTTRATAGQVGPIQQRTAAEASDRKGQDDRMASNEIDALSEKLGKLWNPNCQVEGAASFVVRVRIRLTPQGFLAAAPELPDRDKIMSSGNAMLIASAQRALSAVGRGQPYTDVLKPEHYSDWRDMILKFDPKQTCRMLSAARAGD